MSIKDKEVLDEDVQKYMDVVRKYAEKNSEVIMLSPQERELVILFREFSEKSKEELIEYLMKKVDESREIKNVYL